MKITMEKIFEIMDKWGYTDGKPDSGNIFACILEILEQAEVKTD